MPAFSLSVRFELLNMATGPCASIRIDRVAEKHACSKSVVIDEFCGLVNQKLMIGHVKGTYIVVESITPSGQFALETMRYWGQW